MQRTHSDTTLSVALVIAAAFWGLYWWPLRSLEGAGMAGSWSVVFFNACPLIVLVPLVLFQLKSLAGILLPTLLASVLIGMAFTFYANGLVNTTVVRGVLLYYLTPVWSTLLGVLILSEQLTVARIVAIVVAFFGLVLLLSGGDSASHPLNIGDLYSLLSGIFWAMGLVALNKWARIPIMPLTAFIFIFTTAFSAFFAAVLHAEPVPGIELLASMFVSTAFWSIIVMLPSFYVIFTVSKVLFPGRVGILTMSEVVVTILSAAILLPGESMVLLQWVGAIAILVAGLVEVLWGYTRPSNADHSLRKA